MRLLGSRDLCSYGDWRCKERSCPYQGSHVNRVVLLAPIKLWVHSLNMLCPLRRRILHYHGACLPRLNGRVLRRATMGEMSGSELQKGLMPETYSYYSVPLVGQGLNCLKVEFRGILPVRQIQGLPAGPNSQCRHLNPHIRPYGNLHPPLFRDLRPL